MPVNLSIKNVPDEVVRRLRWRAAQHQRSLEGELLAIIEEAVKTQAPRTLTVDEVLARARRLGLRTPDEATAVIRGDRDQR